MSHWNALRRYTQARIGLQRSGAALGTAELLAFQLAHAQARDAVWHSWDVIVCAEALRAAGIPQLMAASCADDRATYLKRPDLGRKLDPSCIPQLTAARGVSPQPAAEVALILSDGLSATAVETHGVATISAIWNALARSGTECAPVVLVPRARVALSDEIGAALGVRATVIVLGERPGLSAADSLGIYLTYGPKPGNNDAQRNCISNVREPSGLAPALAAQRLIALLHRSLSLGMSGVELKDESPRLA